VVLVLPELSVSAVVSVSPVVGPVLVSAVVSDVLVDVLADVADVDVNEAEPEFDTPLVDPVSSVSPFPPGSSSAGQPMTEVNKSAIAQCFRCLKCMRMHVARRVPLVVTVTFRAGVTERSKDGRATVTDHPPGRRSAQVCAEMQSEHTRRLPCCSSG
jgi:hypothetical protein